MPIVLDAPVIYVPPPVPPDPPPTGVLPPPPTPPFVHRVPPPPRDYDVITWVRSDGVERVLTNAASQVWLAQGLLGTDAPDYDMWESEPPGIDGGIWRGDRARSRTVSLPLSLRARDLEQNRDLRRALVADFNPRLGVGELVYAYPDGTRRTLFCRYATGLNSPRGGYRGGFYRYVYEVELRAHDPYWYGDPVSRTISAPATGDFFPMPPAEIAPSSALGASNEVNDGEERAYPTWTITGPTTGVTIENVTTGKTLELTSALIEGETITITTDPRTPAALKVVDDTGASRWDDITGTSPALWPLEPGDNEIVVDLDSAGPASSVTLAYRLRYLTC